MVYFSLNYLASFLLLLATLSVAHQNDDDHDHDHKYYYVASRATYYATSDGLGTPSGACGYGKYGRSVYDGKVTGVAGLWRGGAGCGACYQVRCTNAKLCSDMGTQVMVTDYGQGDRTDFILSPAGYAAMARDNATARALYKYGVVDVQFRRVSCLYAKHNLSFQVREQSNPHYLSIIILRVGGQNDILSVQAWQNDSKQWRSMRRSYGAVFDLDNPPRGVINLRLQVKGSAGTYKWAESKNVIPANWKPGVAYQSDIILN